MVVTSRLNTRRSDSAKLAPAQSRSTRHTRTQSRHPRDNEGEEDAVRVERARRRGGCREDDGQCTGRRGRVAAWNARASEREREREREARERAA